MHRLRRACRKKGLLRARLLRTAGFKRQSRRLLPSIDLARLRKQVARLIDFYFVPAEFAAHLHEMLDSYVDYSLRRRPAAAPGVGMRTYRTPGVVVRQLEQALVPLAVSAEHLEATLNLADRLWDEGWQETCLLAAFLLGNLPPEEKHVFSRLSAWIAQVREPQIRAKLLDSGLGRARKQAPAMFLDLLREWLRPERSRMWTYGLQAAISAVRDPEFRNLPRLLDVVRPIVEAGPSSLQTDLESLILALHAVSPTETAYFVRQVLLETRNPMTAITFRRLSPGLPDDLREEIREFIGRKPLSSSE